MHASTKLGRAAHCDRRFELIGWRDRHRKYARAHLRIVVADGRHKTMVPRQATSIWWHASDDQQTNATDHAFVWVAPRADRKTVHRRSGRRSDHCDSATCGSYRWPTHGAGQRHHWAQVRALRAKIADITRFMGLIVASTGMQFVLTGLKAFFAQ